MSSVTTDSSARQRRGPPVQAISDGDRTVATGSSVTSTAAAGGGGSHVLVRCARHCFWFMVYTVLIVAAPMVMNHAALYKEQKALMPTPGSLVRINRHQKLFLRCLGHGSPVVVLEAPMGETHSVFEALQLSLAKHTRVCSYDRAGLGFSERPFVNRTEPGKRSKSQGMPHTVEHMVEDLYKLLVVESGLPPPYVLVGAEMGSLITRFFAQIFEGAVAAVVLVDPLVEGAENLEHGALRRHWKETRLFPWQKQQFSAASGLYRLSLLTGMAGDIKLEGLTQRQKDRKRHLLCQPAHWQAGVEELFLLNETMAQIQLLWRIKSFPTNISVSVVTGDPDSSLNATVNRAWQQSQAVLVDKLHPGCTHKRIVGVTGKSLLQKRSSQIHEIVLKALDSAKESLAAAAATSSDNAGDGKMAADDMHPTLMPIPPSPTPAFKL